MQITIFNKECRKTFRNSVPGQGGFFLYTPNTVTVQQGGYDSCRFRSVYVDALKQLNILWTDTTLYQLTKLNFANAISNNKLYVDYFQNTYKFVSFISIEKYPNNICIV